LGLIEAGYQKRTASSRLVPLFRYGSSRIWSVRCIARVPTISGPLGAGTVAVVRLERSDRPAGSMARVTVVALADNPTCCGLSGLSLRNDTDAVYEPAIEGLNVTLIVHEAPALTLAAQLFVSEN
jgi:hypothetical protein